MSQTSYELPKSIDLSSVNPEILESILLRLPKKEIIKCRKVSKLWNQIINTRSFWISKEDIDGENYLRSLADMGKPFIGNDFGLLSIKKPFERELLESENPDGTSDVAKHADSRWTFENGGDRWKYESPPGGFLPDFKNMFDGCHATSFQRCSKHIVFDIKDLWLTPEVMDNHQPPLIFSEWVVNRFDCSCVYDSKIVLYNAENDPIATENQRVLFAQWQQEEWQKVEVVMKSYPPGARFIRIESSGKDLMFWAGHYGSKMAGSSFMIKMEETTPPSNSKNN